MQANGRADAGEFDDAEPASGRSAGGGLGGWFIEHVVLPEEARL